MKNKNKINEKYPISKLLKTGRKTWSINPSTRIDNSIFIYKKNKEKMKYEEDY